MQKLNKKNVTELEYNYISTVLSDYLLDYNNNINIVCLTGDLGTGKTAFAKQLVKNLGSSDYVTSPTYAIVNQYIGQVDIYHLDIYRINELDELESIGFDEIINDNSIKIIEWADIAREILPSNCLWINFNYNSNCNRDMLFEFDPSLSKLHQILINMGAV